MVVLCVEKAAIHILGGDEVIHASPHHESFAVVFVDTYPVTVTGCKVESSEKTWSGNDFQNDTYSRARPKFLNIEEVDDFVKQLIWKYQQGHDDRCTVVSGFGRGLAFCRR